MKPKHYLNCKRCGRKIWNEKNITDGYGKTCWEKRALPFKTKTVNLKGNIEEASKHKSQTKIIKFIK